MVEIEQLDTVEKATKLINDMHKRATGKDISEGTLKHISQRGIDSSKELATAQVMQRVLETVDASFWKKVSTYQAMSHLLNTKTALRNILSNLTMNGAERLSNLLAIPVDKIIAMKTGQRTVAKPAKLLKGLPQAKSSAREASMLVELGLPLGENKYQVGQTFKKGVMGKAEKALRYELQVTDEFQKGLIQADIESQFKAINKGGKLTEAQEKAVQEEMRFRTFQDDTLASTVLTKFKGELNRMGFGKQQRGTTKDVMGKEMFGIREFGLGDFLLKYSKVPGNIITRKIEYSPIGYFKALYQLSQLKADGDVSAQRKAAMSFARATTGSMMLGMGALAKSLGLIIRDEDKDPTGLKKLKLAAGLGNYKLNMTAIGRLLKGESTDLQEGDNLVSYGWIEPIGTSFTVGASIYDAIKNDKKIGDVALGALNQTLEESLDISTLSTIKSMTYGQSALEVMTIPFSGGISGFVPSTLRQTAGTIDPIMRNKYTGGPVEKAVKQTLGAIPFASKTLEPYLSPLGTPRTKNTGALGNIISQFSPAMVSKYVPSPILKPLQTIEKLNVDGKFGEIPYPTVKAPSTLTINDEAITLTDKQKTQYMGAKGKYTEKEYIDKLKGIDVSNISDARIERLLSALSKIRAKSIEVGKDNVEIN